MRSITGETTTAYFARLREKAYECEFAENLDERIKKHIIQTTNNQVLIMKCISKRWDLSHFLSEAAQMEDTPMQVQDMRPEAGGMSVAKISDDTRYQVRNQSAEFEREICNYCGRSNYHPPGRECPVYGKQCRNCLKWNHFVTVCRSKPMNTICRAEESSNQQDRQQQSNKAKKKKVRKTAEVESNSSSSSDDEYFDHAVLKHLGQVKKVKNINDFKKTLDIKINGVDVRAEPDSGADISLMDEHQFKALFNRSARKPILKKKTAKSGSVLCSMNSQ